MVAGRRFTSRREGSVIPSPDFIRFIADLSVHELWEATVEYEEDAVICQTLLRKDLVDVEDLTLCKRVQQDDKVRGKTVRRLRDLLVEFDVLSQSEISDALAGPVNRNESSRLRRKQFESSKSRRRATSRLNKVNPQTVGPFELLEKLGSGGMGSIHKARNRVTEEIVALKLLAPERTKVIDTERFLREARIACSLNHVGLVHGMSFGNDAGQPYFAMEFVEGESLKQRLQREGSLPQFAAMDIILRLARALDYLHSQGHVHRDVKPENVMLSGSGDVKLCDLGLAREMDMLTTLTQTGQAVGTPRYISPEQAHGKKDIDARADLYSLGITAFHMLTGRPPFMDASGIVVLSRHLYDEVPSVREFDPTIHKALAHIVKRMTHKNREKRIASAGELVSELEKLIKNIQRSARTKSPTSRLCA